MTGLLFSEQELLIVDALFDDKVRKEMARLLEQALEELKPDMPLRKLFTEKFSKLPAERKKLAEEEEAGLEYGGEEEAAIKGMEASEDAHFEEMKGHIASAFVALPFSAREAFMHLERLGTTLLLVHGGEGELEKVRLANGYQAIREVSLDARGLPTHYGATVGSELMIRRELWDGKRWRFTGKVAPTQHFRKAITSLIPSPPLAILSSNFIGMNAIMSVHNIMDHVLQSGLQVGINCHPNVLRLTLYLFQAAAKADLLPTLKPEGELCEGGRTAMTLADFETWKQLRVEYFSFSAWDDYDPEVENLSELCSKTGEDPINCRVKLSFEKLNGLAKDATKAARNINTLRGQILAVGGKVDAVVLEWGGLIAFNKAGYSNCRWEDNGMLDEASTRALCKLLWDNIAPLCIRGIRMQSGCPRTLQDGLETPTATARYVTSAWVECLEFTHTGADAFAPGVGDCALPLVVAKRVCTEHGNSCPGAYFQPLMSLVPFTLKEFGEFNSDSKRGEQSVFSEEAWEDMKRRRISVSSD